MFKNLSLYKGLSSIKSYEIDRRITLLILLGTIFVLILTLLGPALLEFGGDDFPSLETGPLTWITEFLSHQTFLSGFQAGFFALIPLFEYLRGHIGEKRFSERTIYAGFPFYIYPLFLAAALFGPSFVFVLSEGH